MILQSILTSKFIDFLHSLIFLFFVLRTYPFVSCYMSGMYSSNFLQRKAKLFTCKIEEGTFIHAGSNTIHQGICHLVLSSQEPYFIFIINKTKA